MDLIHYALKGVTIMEMTSCNIHVSIHTIKQFECRNFQVVELKDNVILLECCDYMLIINVIDDTHLRFTISSGDTCVAVKVKKDDDGFYFKVEQSDSISGDNSIELETIDENAKALKIRTIDYKCSLIRTKSVLKFVAETGEQVELHV